MGGVLIPVEKLLEKCRKSYYESNYCEAINICDEIFKNDYKNQKVIEYKVLSLCSMEKFDEALTLLNSATILYPDNDYFLFCKSDILRFYKKEYIRAAECLEKLLEMGIHSESEFKFLKSDYETYLSLGIDQLIEKEKYVDAWQCYKRMLKSESVNLERSAMIDRFKEHVKKYTSEVKHRQYHVRISSKEAKIKLIEFLKENGFKSNVDLGFLFLIDVVDKTYNSISVDKVGDSDIISESKFYDKVNYYPRGQIVHRQLHDEDGNLVYEGYTRKNSPYGFGKAYFSNGNLYRDGIFDIKGIAQGKEYYPSGQLRFKGQWSLTRGYGPNAPYDGDAYGENGELIYSGKFEIKWGGVGWPMIRNPIGFPHEQKERPKIDYY